MSDDMHRRRVKYASTIAAIFMVGCSQPQSTPPMTNPQIIAAVKQCESAGLKAAPLRLMNGFSEADPRIRVIQCEPKGKGHE